MEDNVCIGPIFIGVFVFVFVFVFIFLVAWQSEKKQAENKKSLHRELKQDKFKVYKTYDIISGGINKQVLFDLDSKIMAVLDVVRNSIDYVDFNMIIDCEIMEDTTTIMKGGIGRAIVGGVLAGGVGAIVGAGTRGSSDVVKNLAVRIITNDISNSLFMITLINSDTKRDSAYYKNCMASAQGIYSTIISILNSSNTDQQIITDSIGSSSFSDQIRELAKLKEEGLLTEDEFKKKKKTLLNLD